MKKITILTTIGIIVCMLSTATVIPATSIIKTEKTLTQKLADPTWEWARSGGGLSLDYGHDIAVDNDGNVYVIGKYFDQALFGTTNLTAYGPIDSWDIYVAKLSNKGDWLWAVGAGGTWADQGSSIALDDDGNVYITGVFYDTAWFGNFTLTAYGPMDVYIAKLDTNGNWLWAVRGGGHAGEAAYGIAIDSNGNSYITGHFMYLATFGTTPLNSQGGADVFVAKLDTNGNWIWAVRGGGNETDMVCDIALDNDGNIYLTGDFEGTAIFGTDAITSQGNADVFITKMDNNGNWQWAISGGSSSIERGYDIVVDSNANVYVTGVFLVSITFGTTTLITQGEWDVYVVKLDTIGDLQWVIRGGSTSSDGTWGITVDNIGNPYITGVFVGSTIFGSTTLISQGIRDIFVAKLNTDGEWQWAISAGGADWDEGYAITYDSYGTTYVTGYFDGSASFGTTTLTTRGEYDVFIAKLTSDYENQPPATPTIDGPTDGIAGEEYTYSFTTTDFENDEVYFYIDWDDGTIEEWIGPYNSEEIVTVNHTWDEKDTYEVKVKAKDSFDAESDWGTLDVTMPVNQQITTYPLLHMLLEQFPNAFPLLRLIINKLIN